MSTCGKELLTKLLEYLIAPEWKDESQEANDRALFVSPGRGPDQASLIVVDLLTIL